MILNEIIKKQNQFQIKHQIMANAIFLGKIAEKKMMEELEPFNHIGVNNPDSETLDGGRFGGMKIKILNRLDDFVFVGRII